MQNAISLAKRFGLSALFLIAVGSQPVAAWTGPYVGVYGSVSDAEAVWEKGSTLQDALNADGSAVGLLAGFMFDVGLLAAGVEADVTFTEIGDTGACANPTFSCSVDLDLSGSLRGKVGETLGPVFAYATGGIAFSSLKTSTTQLSDFAQSELLVGWTAGAGIELSVFGRFRAAMEYRHSAYLSADAISPTVSPEDFDINTDDITVRLLFPLN